MTVKLKKGYKQTELGLIPEDWNFDIIDSLSHRVGDGIHSTPLYLENGEYNFVNGNNLINGNIIITENTKKVSENEYYKHKRDLSTSTILISINGTIGNLAFYNNEKIILGKSAAYINLSKKIDKQFLYQILQTQFIKDYFDNELTGSTIKNLGINSIRNAPIPLPPLPEQKAIAQVLSDTDNLLQAITQKLVKKRAIKQGAMQQLLTPKEDWEVKTLGDIGKTFGGMSGKVKADFSNGNSKYIPFMNVMNNPIIDTSFLANVFIKPKESQNKAIQGDLFFNGSSETPEEVGLCSVLLEDISNLYLNSFCFGFRLFNKEEIKGIYLSYFFRSDEGRKLFYSLAQGATRYNLSKANFLKLEFAIPNSQEQIQIATILSDMDEEIAQLEEKLAKYKLVKQGLMQELLTGKIRLV